MSELNVQNEKQVDESRRKFLTKSGKYAVVAPVALTTLMNPAKNAAASSSTCTSSCNNLPVINPFNP